MQKTSMIRVWLNDQRCKFQRFWSESALGGNVLREVNRSFVSLTMQMFQLRHSQ